MSKVSILIPTRDEPYLRQTVEGLLAGAAGDIEIIVVLDGQQEAVLPEDKRITMVFYENPVGRRAATNTAAAYATGKYLMKIDAHCKIKEGYDEVLQADCADNWIVVPRRFHLDAPSWSIINDQKHVDAMYYLFPYTRPNFPKLTCRPWKERANAREHILIDEDMGFQGSMWFMSRAHWDRLGGMSEEGYGTFVSEPEEFGLKTQLGPWEGKVMRNKKTWYAHWAKPQSHWRRNGNGWMGWVTEKEWWDGWTYCADYWWNNRWAERAHDFQWLIEKFWPLPEWPEDWRSKKWRMITAP